MGMHLNSKCHMFNFESTVLTMLIITTTTIERLEFTYICHS